MVLELGQNSRVAIEWNGIRCVMGFSKIDDIFSREIVRGGEAYLDGQLRVATSADQRASSLAGVFSAAATALLAATVALANPAWNIPAKRKAF